MRHRVKWINSLEFALQIFFIWIFLLLYYAEFFARIIWASVLVAFKMLYFFFCSYNFCFYFFLFCWHFFDGCSIVFINHKEILSSLYCALVVFFLSIFKRQKHIHVISFSETFSKQSVVFGFAGASIKFFFISSQVFSFSFFFSSVSFNLWILLAAMDL